MKKEQHGMYGTPEYRAWVAMKTRCYNKNSVAFDRYGGAGVEVCEQWRISFSAFFADMGVKPSPLHTMDRLDNKKGYEPGNCRWATQKQQSANREICKLEFDGMVLPIQEWARLLGISTNTIRRRRRKGLTIDQVLAPATPREKRWGGAKFWESSPNFSMRAREK